MSIETIMQQPVCGVGHAQQFVSARTIVLRFAGHGLSQLSTGSLFALLSHCGLSQHVGLRCSTTKKCCNLQHLKRSKTSKSCNLQHLRRCNTNQCCYLQHLRRSKTDNQRATPLQKKMPSHTLAKKKTLRRTLNPTP